MLKVTLRAANGKVYELTGAPPRSNVVSPREALVSVVGVSTRSDQSVPGRSGAILGQQRYSAIQTELPFKLYAESGEEMETRYKEFRQGWSDQIPSTLEVEADHPLGKMSLDMVLHQPLPGVSVDASTQVEMDLAVQIYAKRGLFRSTDRTGTGTVAVQNQGDAIIYPRIKHGVGGGQVKSPSGAVFSLPPTAGEINLDPEYLRTPGAFPEGVRVGSSSTWVLPAGATLVWNDWVADPWA